MYDTVGIAPTVSQQQMFSISYSVQDCSCAPVQVVAVHCGRCSQSGTGGLWTGQFNTGSLYYRATVLECIHPVRWRYLC